MPKTFLHVLSAAVLLIHGACASDPAMRPGGLTTALSKRLAGDRTGACVAAAIVDTQVERVERAFVCADPKNARNLSGTTAFEIGSISKTMTAFLLEDLIERGTLRLDDPLSMHVPEGTAVPAFGDEPIRLRHLVTHTSGLPELPPGIALVDLDNPYAALADEELLASLAHVQLTAAPGSAWAYSNYGFMLLSYVVSHASGDNLESQLRERLFTPLGMQQAFIEQAPAGVETAQGHGSVGNFAPAWDFSVDLAGVGGVRASLDDMVRYAQAALGSGDRHTAELLRRAQEPLARGPGRAAMGMGWVLLPTAGHTVAMHDGGTGGFSSLVLVDRTRRRAVILLIDTSFANLGGVLELGLHLLDPTAFALPAPRTLATPQSSLLEGLAGRYRLGDLNITLRADHGSLFALPEGQAELELAFDSYGDFFPRVLDGLLTPIERPDGSYTFRWTQGGGTSEAVRLP